MLESTIIDKIVEQVVQQTVGWHILCVSSVIALAVSFIFWIIVARLVQMSGTSCLGKVILAYIIAFFVALGGYSTYLEKDLSKRIQDDPDQTALMSGIKEKIVDLEKDVALVKKNEEAHRVASLKDNRSLVVRMFGTEKAALISLAMIFGMLLGAGGTRLIQAILDRERQMAEQAKVHEERQDELNQPPGEHHARSH